MRFLVLQRQYQRLHSSYCGHVTCSSHFSSISFTASSATTPTCPTVSKPSLNGLPTVSQRSPNSHSTVNRFSTDTHAEKSRQKYSRAWPKTPLTFHAPRRQFHPRPPKILGGLGAGEPQF
eukprot:103088-Rhodomonas_salina.3